MSREGLGDDGGYEALGPGSAEATPKQPAKTPGATTLGQFALRPGDDVDLSSERGGPEDKGPKKSKEKAEREKRLEVPLKSIVLDIKPYKEPKFADNAENLSHSNTHPARVQLRINGVNGRAVCRYLCLAAYVIG
ncbi:hypothetical protein RB195_017935 [Necator americanus]|uniref:Uncharacterized protein n=1 Tax=Necator americanus TaxID=51031 RepID=A0ABR1C7H5_NECAM